MIISLRSLSYENLKKQLVPEDKIVIISCDTCVKACGIGGSAMMSKLADMLVADGYHVLGKDLISIGCTVNLVEKHRNDIKKKDMYDAATVVIPLICQDGLEGVEYVFKDKKVICIAKTVGIGNFTMDRGAVLTHPFESTGLPENPNGYALSEVAEKLNLYGGFFDEKEFSEKQKEHVTLTINGQKISALKNQNLLTVCMENKIDLPHLCFHDDLTEYGACRLCLVKIKGRKDFAAACCTHVEGGMEVLTEDKELDNCRRVILELLMASGHHNCLTCSKGVPTPMASCELQGLIRQAGIHESRYEESTETKPEDDSSPVIYYDPNKCVLCGRCVRACQEISGLSNLGFVNRGDKTVVAAGFNTEINQSACAACMACVNVCPTGALNEKVVYFSGANWTPSRKYMSL
ncbi:2Fe-2S iron-sulfur cluster-binding protein [Caproicibacter fermentans]|uniref:Ferredoxin n=1 Tax=Caproicibacter fermentans TaxID=2576756 RepID=A0A7G8T8H5_9FIRM|nr:2Fe-2S iron-sulfur cluster-binding protein [Caproicibacter fermentans]QNK39916.1 (2Fe-2S)-binding protein [Caproicibacter fermentans]